jgi:hypothetical protein
VFKMRGRDINIDIDAGRSETLTIKPLKEGGEAWDFSGVVVSGELRDIRTDGTVMSLECGVTETGSIEVKFPALDGGQYVFAVDMSGGDGGATRLIDGYVTWGEPKAVIEETEETDERCLLVYVDGERRKAVWTWSKEAQRMYEAAKNEADKAEMSAIRAEKAADSVTGDVQVQLLAEIAAALKDFESKAGKVIQANKVTNTWWIAGVDTGVQLTGDKGDMGFSPYISALGNWIAWDEQSQKAVDTHIRAQGRDGIDGEAVRRVLVDSLPDLPQSAQEAMKHRGIFYMLQTDSGYEVYALLETADGAFSWVDIGNSNAFATHVLYGIVKLGTSSIVSGAPVGLNANGTLEVSSATSMQAGVVIKSLSLADIADKDVPTVNAVRAWLGEHHYEQDAVDEKIETVTNSIADVSDEVDKLVADVSVQDGRITALGEEIQRISEAHESFATKTEVNDAINEAYSDITDGVKDEIFVQLSAEEYAKITPQDGVLYLIPEE